MAQPPPGERTGFMGWLREIGFQGGQPPERRWERQNVHVIGDESELTSFLPGPRGTGGGTQAIVAAEFSAFQFVGGNSGARVAFTVSTNSRFKVTAPITLSATAPGPVALPIASSDLTLLCTSTLQRGSLVAELDVNSATLIVTAPIWVGTPIELWVPAGRALVVWAITAGALMHGAFVIREPGSASD